MRTNAKNEFEVSFFKLMNNAVFGKQLESVRQRSGIKIVSGESVIGKKRLRKLISNPCYKGSKIFANSELISVNMAKQMVKLDKPVMVGQAILDTSKLKMFSFWYDYAKPKWGNNIRLLMTDTDSFMMEIKTEDVYKERFDTSNYKEQHPSGLPIGVNKKVPGKMKDEMGGKIVTSFVV